jgi:light-harvesting complex 1 beta chain
MATETKGRNESLSGLTDGEAKEFHKIFMSSFFIFMVIAIIAHILAWIWRPWLQTPASVDAASLTDGAHQTLTTIMPFVA